LLWSLFALAVFGFVLHHGTQVVIAVLGCVCAWSVCHDDQCWQIPVYTNFYPGDF